MSTIVDAQWFARRLWWILPEALAALAMAGAALAVPATLDPDELRARLEAQIVRGLEAQSPVEHHNHGHEINASDVVLCTAELIGTDPREPARLSEVRAAYAVYMCAAGAPGTPYERASKISGPVVLRLGRQPVVQIAQAGAGYRDQVRELLPDEFEERGFASFQDRQKPLNLMHEFQSRVSSASPEPSA